MVAVCVCPPSLREHVERAAARKVGHTGLLLYKFLLQMCRCSVRSVFCLRKQHKQDCSFWLCCLPLSSLQGTSFSARDLVRALLASLTCGSAIPQQVRNTGVCFSVVRNSVAMLAWRVACSGDFV